MPDPWSTGFFDAPPPQGATLHLSDPSLTQTQASEKHSTVVPEAPKHVAKIL